MSRILVVDDDPQLRQSFKRVLASEGYDVATAATAIDGIEAVGTLAPDLVVMDVRMPGMDGLTALEEMRTLSPKLQVIIMTAYASTASAIEATKLGAYDYILKPFDIPDVLELIKKAVKAGHFMRSRVRMDSELEGDTEAEAIIGKSPEMQAVYKSIGRVAPTDATVMIRGESGTGKELVARAIYQHSRRSDAAFQVINCVAIPETLLESELFGFEKGAFTGASSRRIGKIEQAHEGTVFLDEIGDMPLGIQAKILRLLQERSIERLGGRNPIPVDVRILAATHVDLEAAVAAGRFREDLYYRLNVVSLQLPPLRNRLSDVPALARYFLAKHARETRTPVLELTADGEHALTAHDWPGNVRELANVVQKALIFNRGARLGREEVQQAISSDSRRMAGNSVSSEADMETIIRAWIRQELGNNQGGRVHDQLMERFGAMVIGEALAQTGGNRSQAAKLLGLSRPTLIAKIEKFHLTLETVVSGS